MDKKWNLQDIRRSDDGGTPRKKPKRTESVKGNDVQPREDIRPKEKQREQRSSRRTRRRDFAGQGLNKKLITLGVAVIAIIVAGVGLSMFLGGADLTVYPKTRDVNVDARFTAYTQPAAGTLGYEILTLEADAERQVTATGREEVSERAIGTITIYNEYSDSSQRLITNTRFESDSGLIFRIRDSVDVPGRTTDEAGNVVPGSVSAEAFADGTGDEYNIAPTTFTIPGLEGSEQFDSMYARSEASFSGGFEGERYIVDEEELASAQDSLREELQEALRARLANERPAGFVLYDDAITFTFETLDAVESGDGQATITERGRLQAPLFAEGELASFISHNTIVGYEGESVRMNDPSALSFNYVGTTTVGTDIQNVDSLEFTLRGDVSMIWQFDSEQLRRDLAGASKTALPTVLSGYSAIERAEVDLKPFWQNSFPAETDDIHIHVVTE